MLGIVKKCRESTHQVISVSLKVIAANFSFANSATTLAKKPLFSSYTSEPIQEKNLLIAHCANSLAPLLIL